MKIKSFFKKRKQNKKNGGKGQSLVELTLSLPLLLMLLSGMVEFGFMLNYKLSLIDATREVARLFSNFDPIDDPDTAVNEVEVFYPSAVDQVLVVLEPQDINDTSRKIDIRNDAEHPDDIVISVYSVNDGVATLVNDYHWSNNQPSRFDVVKIEDRLIASAPATGVLVVEVFYNYDQVLGLPWLRFLPDPILLYAHTVMPNSAAEPTPTPGS